MSALTPSSPPHGGSSYRRFIQIDEDGYFKMDQLRVADAETGHDWLARLSLDERRRPFIEMDGAPVLVEAFDEPFVAVDIEKGLIQAWSLIMPYGHREAFAPQALSLDEWDRFHGHTERGIPFVLSRSAQSRFFNLLDDFDDTSIVIDGQRIAVQPWLRENPEVNSSSFWEKHLREEQPRWDLGAPTPALVSVAPRLKLSPARVLVPGTGRSHDAAWLAEQGHHVTAVDFSADAIKQARERYGHLRNLEFMQADIFKLPTEMNSSFDMIFEHTCYCAITPSRRNELIRAYRRALTDQGFLLGVFYTMDRPIGPPYGGSEWELRARLEKTFRLLYWMRSRESVEKRLGQELLIYAQKIPSLR